MKSRKGKAHASLTPYESEQAEAIALWKSTPPSPLSEMWKMIVVPVAKLVECVVPDMVIRQAIERTYDASAFLAGQNDILRQANVSDLGELRGKPLEECDRLSKRAGMRAESLAGIEGVATGLGGMWTTALDVPILFGLALRTIIKVGHCYGYPLDQRNDRPFVLGVLNVATSGSLATRRERLSQLRGLDDYLLAETQVSMVKEEALSFLFQLEVFEEVPGIGAVTGGVLNLTFMQRVELTARRVFQERWLLDNGKIESPLVPSDVPDRQLAPGWSGAMGRALYGGCYYAGFGAALPFCLAAGLMPPVDNALTRGVRDGAAAALKAAGLARAGEREAMGRSLPSQSEAVPALA